MAEDEMTNDQQPTDGADNPGPESAETPEASTGTGGEAEESGEPSAEAGADAAPTEDAAPPTAAEQLANEALAAARSAVSELENGDSADTSDTAPVAAPSPASNGTATASNGAMMGGGAGSAVAPAPFTPEILTQLASVQGGEGIDILADVELNVKIELGKTKMLVEDVLRLTDGAVVELDKLAGDPVDIYVNDRHVARGEVLILNDNFCVRVSEILEATIEER